jgi:microcystin-dependent protein
MGQPYVGEIRIFGGNFAPAGWSFCDGRLVPISENDTLFNLIGTTYGGDGQSTFGLPDLRGRVPLHQGTLVGNTFVIGTLGGVETVTLAANTVPTHTHTVLANSSASPASLPGGNYLAAGPDIYDQGKPGSATMASAISSVGGSQPHDNFQPYLCLDFIISLYGIYPSPS